MNQPVVSELDERTREGDDHPARLFIRFETSGGLTRAMELFWNNVAFRPGEYKYIGGFPHYVAESGTATVSHWVEESLDLKAIYEEIWLEGEDPRVTYLAISCDTDDTDNKQPGRVRKRHDDGPLSLAPPWRELARSTGSRCRSESKFPCRSLSRPQPPGSKPQEKDLRPLNSAHFGGARAEGAERPERGLPMESGGRS